MPASGATTASDSPGTENLAQKANFQISDRFSIAAICLGWAALVALVNPSGNFPLNDDWAFAVPVKSLVDSGTLHFSGWTAPNLIAQALWGTLFCFPFGFSFTTLRLSTLVLGLLAGLSFYGILRNLGSKAALALFATALLLLNPIFFELSYTFMTDVPFLGFSLLALWLFLQWFKRGSPAWFVFGLFAACAALLVRQNGFFLLLALGLAYLASRGLSRASLARAALAIVLAIVVQESYSLWLRLTDRTPVLFGGQIRFFFQLISISFKMPHIGYLWLRSVAEATALTFLYCGFFVLPIFLAAHCGYLAKFIHERKRLAIYSAAALIAIAVISLRHWPLWFTGQVLYDFGLGPPSLRDEYVLQYRRLPTASVTFWVIVTIIAAGCAIALLFSMLQACRLLLRQAFAHQTRLGPFVMIFATLLLNLIALIIVSPMDRYLLMVLPFAIAIIAAMSPEISEGRLRRFLGLAVLGAFALFSVAGTHDYLAWNRARWGALTDLMNVYKIAPEKIDGGYEFNGMYLFNPYYHESRDKSWYWVGGDDVVVSFGTLPGYKVAAAYPYRAWMPPRRAYILVLTKLTK
jgi:4-amino-4-deoxy-L-arabinose transferase-like glycosyltransferase